MSATRRTFMQQSLAAARSRMPAGRRTAGRSPRPHQALARRPATWSPRWSWLNPPASVTYGGGRGHGEDQGRAPTSGARPIYGYVTDNGHFFHLPVFGEFTLPGARQRQVRRAL